MRTILTNAHGSLPCSLDHLPGTRCEPRCSSGPFRSPAWLRRHTKAHRPSDTHSLLSLAEVTRRFGRIIAERIEIVGFVQKAFNRRLRRHGKLVREQHCLTELMVPLAHADGQ